MSRIAIIPARGGSKRIPRKNIRSFCGKPIIQYSIEVALNSGLFDTVMVSTDDTEIAQIALDYGASVPFPRSESNSNDFATTTDVLLEVINHYEKLGQNYNQACCIYPTAPFLSASLLVNSLQLFTAEKYETLFPVVAFDYPIQRSLSINDKGKVEMVWPEYLQSRSQDLTLRYHDSGMFYWFLPYILKQGKSLFTENSGSLIVSHLDCHDIDTIEDWEIAELKFKRSKH